MTISIIGIDPGISGGIACFRDGAPPEVYNMPETPHDLTSLLARLSHPSAHAYVELVAGAAGGLAQRQGGARGMLAFGRNVGMIHGILAALEIPYELVSPAKWQKAMGCMTGQKMEHKEKKSLTRAKAQQLFPSVKVTHAVADALLIGEYGRRLRNGLDARQVETSCEAP